MFWSGIYIKPSLLRALKALHVTVQGRERERRDGGRERERGEGVSEGGRERGRESSSIGVGSSAS